MVPLLNNQYMNVWKNSSLAVVVAYTDIFYVILVMMNNVASWCPCSSSCWSHTRQVA